MEQWTEPLDLFELAGGLCVVAALLVCLCSCRVGDRALGDLVEPRFLDQQERLECKSLRVSMLADLCGCECHVAEAVEPYVCELWPIATQS